MKKLLAVFIALILFLGSVLGTHYFSKKTLEDTSMLIYDNCDVRNTSNYVMDKILDNNSVLVMGSSELADSGFGKAYPKYLFNYGNSDFNMILYGRGYMQSLSHAIDIGALQNNIKDNKAVLILSPQWFTKDHYDSTIFASRFYESSYIELLNNPDISFDTKKKISERVKSLLSGDPTELETVCNIEKTYLYNDSDVFSKFNLKSYEAFMQEKSNFLVAKEARSVEKAGSDEKVYYKNIDFNKLMEEETKEAIILTSNNEFGIENDYFNTYIKDSLEDFKDSMIDSSYCDSQEYEDLRLFLDVCKETGIAPLIVSVPVNGYWYDYTGFSYDDRQQYYQNIRDICNEYQVELADFSNMEYEKYFLKDIMHLGWKGWIYVDQAVYNYYKK